MADQSDLTDPPSIASALGVELEVRSDTTRVLACPGQEGSLRTTQFGVGSPWWYKALASGAGKVPLPAIAINPAATSGDPSFAYKVESVQGCAGVVHLRNEARVSFGGLPAYACFTVRDLRRAFPKIIYQVATDGYSGYVYPGRRDTERTTSLSFTFRFGSDCALSAEVRQVLAKQPAR